MDRAGWIVIAVALTAAACGSDTYTRPSPSPTPTSTPNPGGGIAATVSSIRPAAGWPLYYTEVFGSGFTPGMHVTFDGADAAFITVIDSGKLVVWPPVGGRGAVEVKVTWADGRSATVPGGYTYKIATITASPADVQAGASIDVSWYGPDDPSDFGPPDIVGLYREGDPDSAMLWYEVGRVGGTGSSRVSVAQPGNYEFRYLMASRHLLATTRLLVR